MDTKQTPIPRALEAEIIGALAFTEAKELLEREGTDYFRGFMAGYSHCLKLAEEFDDINRDEGLR